MNIVFFGTSSFAAQVLHFLLEKKENIVAIVTRPDRPQGRSLKLGYSPVKELALSTYPSLPLLQPEKASSEEFVQTIKTYQPDLFIVVAYGEILKKDLLQSPALGAVNIHASLLPKYRGAAPMQWALLEGEKETGITIIDMVEQMDAGDILEMEKIPIPEEMTFGELSEQLCQVASEVIFKVIQSFKTNSVKRIPQNHAIKTFAPKIKPQDEEIDWKNRAQVIHNQIRALSPAPGAWTLIEINGVRKRLKILRASYLEGVFGLPGDLQFKGQEGWVVGCGEGGIRLLEVQLEGKRLMSADLFFQGQTGKIVKFGVR